MAKKRPLFGVSNYVKRTRKKRPGRHTKNISKRIPRRKNIEDKADERYCYKWFTTNYLF